VPSDSPTVDLASLCPVKTAVSAGCRPEGISIFADSFTVPSDDTIMSYLKDKEELGRNIIRFLSGTTEPRPAPSSAVHETIPELASA